jgi:peptidoglycan/xylan/chitin deacetylase (PgdA/CDA1 family)
MSGLPGSARAGKMLRDVAGVLRRRSSRGVILLYHRIAGPRFDPQWLDVSASNFSAQLEVLRTTATILPLDEFNFRRRRGTLPRRAVAITFDDGYLDNLVDAAPLLAAHGAPATVFVTSGMIGANREFWWDDLERIAFSASALNGPVPGLALAWSAADAAPAPADVSWNLLSATDPGSRHRLYRALCAAVYPLDAEAREVMLRELRDWANVPTDARASHRTLTSDELRQLARAPGITIGAHSVAHCSLARLVHDEQYRELEESRAALIQALSLPVRAVAYPYGQPDDVSAVTVRAASFAGYDYAVAVSDHPAWRCSAEYRLPRCVVRDWDGETFARHLDRWFAA